jgi:hypothetical protein
MKYGYKNKNCRRRRPHVEARLVEILQHYAGSSERGARITKKRDDM